jgi:type I restriction enzyme S subunit
MNHAPDNWDNVAIEDFGEIIGGGTPSRANASLWKGSIPWVTPSEITSLRGKFVRETKEKITPEGLTGSAAKLLPVGSLLVTTRATMGEMAIAAVPLTTNQGFKNIIPNESTDSLFAYYQIRMLKADMVRLASGTTFLEISKADFSRIRTNRPKHPEQRRIAFVLDTMDEAIAKTEAVIAKLKQVRAGLLHDLLTRGLDENDQLRDPIAHPEQFQDSPLGCIPRDWVTAEIATLCDLGRGRVISQLDLEKNPGIYPVYSSQSANEGVFGYLGTFDFDGDYVTWTTDGANAGTVFFRSGRFNCTNVCGTLQSRGEIIESFPAKQRSLLAMLVIRS